ncbi:putative uncharacterized protein DDB_G0277255 [Condylostylus longicornis]|uniref:putative uncharacterized protein DDB_G0277255 n=1 Tax=Condylostylus longicornis TaxID=2530218 RepID=UPI00244DCA1C|nr:putative uncharacterized protein DDB_G0277255 [Condylostylus longicornis]
MAIKRAGGVPAKAAKLIYSGHILSQIRYNICNWSICTKFHINQMGVVMNRSLKTLYNLNPRMATKELYIKTNELDINQLIYFEKCKYVFKITNKKMKTSLLIPTRDTVHNYNTRQRRHLMVPKACTSMKLKGLKCSAIRIFNTLPDDIRNCKGNSNKIKDEPNAEAIIRANIQTGLRIFKEKLPEPMRSVIFSRNPASLEDAIEVLYEGDYADFNPYNSNNRNFYTNKNFYRNNKSYHNTSNTNTNRNANNDYAHKYNYNIAGHNSNFVRYDRGNNNNRNSTNSSNFSSNINRNNSNNNNNSNNYNRDNNYSGFRSQRNLKNQSGNYQNSRSQPIDVDSSPSIIQRANNLEIKNADCSNACSCAEANQRSSLENF